MWDLLLIAGVGFLGSFGHCVGMCGPLAVALSLSQQAEQQQRQQRPDQQQSTPDTDPSGAGQREANVLNPGQTQQMARVEHSVPNCTQHNNTVSTAQKSCHTDSSSGQSNVVSPLPSVGLALWPQLRFHLLLNLGRLLSYTLVGIVIGAIGSALVAGGQVAGIGSDLRRGLTIVTGLLLIWFGLSHVNPGLLPRIPILNPVRGQGLHSRLQKAMGRLSLDTAPWTPVTLGLVWGLIPCGFLYAAQLKAASTANGWLGGATMLAFGIGTLPSMISIGLVSTKLGANQRHQLFRIGGWLTLVVGILTLLRTGDQMVDYSGHAALICLLMALLARPISRLWVAPLQYRRTLGVGAFVLSMVHVLHTLEHAWSWNIQALFFMLPQHQWGVGFGIGAVLLMLPLTVTSFDGAQKRMRAQWRQLHLLSVPALALVVAHCLLVGSNYLGRVQFTWVNVVMITALLLATVGVMLARSPLVWSILSMEKWYVPPKQ